MTSSVASSDARVSRWLPWIGWACGLALVLRLIQLARVSTGFYWRDDYAHLLIARRALHDPVAILDVWGRPLMTLAYMPAALSGEAGARATSLVLLVATALLCVDICRRHDLAAPSAVLVFLIAQPLTATVSMGALPQTLFGLVVAAALCVRARGHQASAAAVISLLPLTRLEGIVVLLVWGVVLVLEGKRRFTPLLAVGLVVWAVAGWISSGEPLWLLNANPYGVLGSAYGAAGWRYLFLVLPLAFGPAIAGIAFFSLAKGRMHEPLVASIAVALPVFYGLSWTLPAFQSIATPVYLVSVAVPFALCAHDAVSGLLDRAAARWALGGAIALAVALLSASARLVGVVIAIWAAWSLAPRLSGALRAMGVALVIVGTFAFGAVTTKPLPLDGTALLARNLAADLGADARRVSVSTEPAFNWFSGGTGVYGRNSISGDFPLLINRVRPGGWIVWDSGLGAARISRRELHELGFRIVRRTRAGDDKLNLYERRTT